MKEFMASISDILVQSASLPTGNCGDDEDGGNCGDVNVGAVTIKDCGDDDNSFGGGDSCGGGGGFRLVTGGFGSDTASANESGNEFTSSSRQR